LRHSFVKQALNEVFVIVKLGVFAQTCRDFFCFQEVNIHEHI
jgi:hypothetical protein